MSSFWESITTVLVAITGVAIVAVLVSRNANTAAVIQSGASGFSNALDVAVSPVTGNSASPNLGYPGGFSFGGVGMGMGIYG